MYLTASTLVPLSQARDVVAFSSCPFLARWEGVSGRNIMDKTSRTAGIQQKYARWCQGKKIPVTIMIIIFLKRVIYQKHSQ